LDYVALLIDSNRFEKALFGNWFNRVEKYLNFKKSRRENRPKNQNQDIPREDTYVEKDLADINQGAVGGEDGTVDVEDDDDVSFKSTETVKEPDSSNTNQNTKKPKSSPPKQGIISSMMARLPSFDARTENQ